MHSAWQTDDIRHLIFERLEPQDLARIARTCRLLLDLATDELWRTITTFQCFISCLPKDLRKRPLQIEDIRRLEFYAPKVQNIQLESKDIKVVIRLPRQFQPNTKHFINEPGKSWEELWREIAKLRSLSELLVNLRRLRVSNAVEDLLIPLIGISGLNLTQIYIKYLPNKRKNSVVLRILNRLKETPKLEYLFFRDGADLIPPRLIKQAPLKHLRLDPRIHSGVHAGFNFKTISIPHQILEKSMLEHLTIGLSRDWYTPEIKALQGKYLPALKTLWLNLTTFRAERCNWLCNNTGFNWTCACQIGIPAMPCERRPPTVFLQGLDNPELNLLNIKFPFETTGSMFLAVVSAANKSCRLQNLTELALAGGVWFSSCTGCGKRPAPKIEPADLRKAMKLLLPMPHLKTLRLSVAPNFLDILDLDLYKSIADGLPSLETLWLGHSDFLAESEFESSTFYERTPLHHLAAFCSMLPNLVEVSIGYLDGVTLEETPHEEWACPTVTSLKVVSWAGGREEGTRISRDLLHLGLRTYFPNSDRAKKEYDEQEYMFDR